LNESDRFDFEIVDASSMAFVHKKILYDDSGFVRDFLIVHVNRAFELLLGVSANDLCATEESNFFGYAKENYQRLLKDYSLQFEEKRPFFIDIYSPKFHKWMRIYYEHVRNDYYISWVLDVNAEKILMQTSNEMFQSGMIQPKTIAERACRISETPFVFFCQFRDNEAHPYDHETYTERMELNDFSENIARYFTEISKRDLMNSFTKADLSPIGNSTLNISSPEDYLCTIHLLIRENKLKGLFLFLYQKGFEIRNIPFLLTFTEQVSMLMHGNELVERRMTAEKSLKQKEKNYRIMTENATDGVAVIQQKKLKYISPSYRKMLLLGEEEELNSVDDVFVNVPEEYRQQIKQNFRRVSENVDEVLTQRYPVVKKDGTKTWLEDNMRLLIEEEGAFETIYLNGRDVTKQVQYENELVETKKRIEKANSVKTEFMMNMSHELRTPLNGILGFSSLLKGTDLDNEQLEYISNIEVSGRRLLGIVNDILDFTKIQTYKMKITHEPVMIREMLGSLINMISRTAEDKNIETLLEFDDNIPEKVCVDKIKLSQILSNLLMNALKFTEKGKIILKAVLFTRNHSKAIIRFSVLDTGIGIDPSVKKLIFESFTQADSSLSRQYGGTGLGLSISNGILNLMDSRLNLTSESGKGSEFSFILTLEICDEKNEPVDSEKQQKETVNPDYKQLKILIVEDNQINLKLNETIVRRHYPYAKIFEAMNGKEAIENHMKNHADLILMDVRMPEMNGLESTRIIRKNLKDNDVIIIGLSAEAHKDKIYEGIASGMDDYITKPVIPNELIKIINKYI